MRWLKTRHRWRWTAVRRHLTDHNGRWSRPSADGITLFNLEKVGVTRYRYRGAVPALGPAMTAVTVESPLRRDSHGGFGERPGLCPEFSAN